MPLVDSWPEALVAITGLALVIAVVVTLIHQAFTTWRARMSVAREQAYQQLAAEAVRAHEESNARLDVLHREVTELRRTTAELERLLSTVA